MFMLVTVDKVRTALKLDSGESDALIASYISAASRAIVRYLKGQASSVLPIDSPPNSPPDDLSSVPEDVQLACIILTGVFYRDPDGADGRSDFGDSNVGAADPVLPLPVRALLHPLRDPALA